MTRHSCEQCGRALAPCDWCGESDLLSEAGPAPVIVCTEPLGNFHEPCRQAYLETVRKLNLGSVVAEGA